MNDKELFWFLMKPHLEDNLEYWSNQHPHASSWGLKNRNNWGIEDIMKDREFKGVGYDFTRWIRNNNLFVMPSNLLWMDNFSGREVYDGWVGDRWELLNLPNPIHKIIILKKKESINPSNCKILIYVILNKQIVLIEANCLKPEKNYIGLPIDGRKYKIDRVETKSFDNLEEDWHNISDGYGRISSFPKGEFEYALIGVKKLVLLNWLSGSPFGGEK
tara:strand:+ start:263 stop:913 length:651 start_codon:yes stop_codon:yes gene_type:complete